MKESSDKKILICEVGPRDGLQSEKRIWSVEERVEFINRLTATGFKRLEAVSFVNPKRVPQMADAEAVMKLIKRRKGVSFAGLALNLRGVERALEAGVDIIRYVVVASETFNMKNQGATIDETIGAFEILAGTVHNAGRALSATIGASFGCPFEGDVPAKRVASIAQRLVNAGANEIILADTIGCAVPNQVVECIELVSKVVGNNVPLGCHFHNTRNTGFANSVAAISAGVRRLDSSVGGIGGCPFAPRATGNIATEDLCYMLRQMCYCTGINLENLIDVSKWTETFFSRPLPGQVMKAGLFPEIAAEPVT
jgi:isopropylmalate/homocitrate/citramalate synthase